MRKVLLGDICKPKQWKTISTSMLTEEGYSVYGANGVIGKYSEYNHKEETLLVTCRGATCGRLNICEPYSYVNGNAMALDDLDESVDIRYLYYVLKERGFKDVISGSAQPQIIRSTLEKIPILIGTKTEQKEIVRKLALIDKCIEGRKSELQQLDELIKSRFVEMFVHKEDYIEGGHPVLNPSHIVDGKVAPDSKLTISDKKYNELEAYHLHIGDVVMGRRGEMGRCAVVPSGGFLCGTGSLLIRTKGEVTADYIQKIISFPSFRKTIEDMAVGQTMPNLNVPIVSKFQIIKPPIEVQKNYYKFVAQTDKSKLTIQKSLDELETLNKALMQKYFGGNGV